MNRMVKIVGRENYDKTVERLEGVAAKGEDNLTEEELKWMEYTAQLVAAYEEKNGMHPLDVKSVHENETDIQRIAAALGYVRILQTSYAAKCCKEKLNQKSLAVLLNMAEAKVSQILSGRRVPDVDFLRGIHAKLGIDGNVLLEIA